MVSVLVERVCPESAIVVSSIHFSAALLVHCDPDGIVKEKVGAFMIKRLKCLFTSIFKAGIAVFLVVPLHFGLAQSQEPKITVLNPLGQPPPTSRVPMAPRLTSLEGKTIYIVDVGFTDTHQFLTEMQKLLSEKYPKTTWVVKTKIGNYFEDDPKLWAEIKEKGHGMIMGVGH